MNPFDVYRMYIALKMHFTSPTYDFVKYRGKVNLKIENFEKRKDIFHFKKVSKLGDETTIKKYFIANLTENKDFWIGDYELGKKNYHSYISRLESLSYNFKNELKMLDKNLPKNIECNGSTYPKLLNLYYNNNKKISLETLIILLDLLKVKDYFDSNMGDDVFWKSTSFLIEKYRPFFKYDEKKFKEYFIEFCKSCKESA